MRLLTRTNLVRTSCELGFLILTLAVLSSAKPVDNSADRANSFRWIHPGSDPQLWQQIQSAFRGELLPDEPKEGQGELDVYRYKYLLKVGVIDHSALVILGHRPTKEVSKGQEWDEYYSAFNFDLTTRRKSIIEHAERMWKWKFRTLATFGPFRVPDVTFTYLSCTECEPELVFASLQYDPTRSAWHVRSWGDETDIWWAATDGLVVSEDVNNGGDTMSFDCVYGVLSPKTTGFQDLAIRCKEVTYRDTGRAKINDFTLYYGLSGGKFERRLITDFSEAAAMNARICRPGSQSLLCKLPWYLTATSGQNAALDEMFPNAPKTSRDLANFLTLKRTMSMMDVVRRCGSPDEVGGSGIAIFVYHLNDGSLVAVGATGATEQLLYASHIETSGKASALIPAK
jgi:hypothetical protein